MTRENLIKELFKRKYPNEKVFYNYRPEWIINPQTGHRLELDIYYPDLKIAIEINGLHHETEYQKYKDSFKILACKERGIILERLPLKNKALKALIKKYHLDTRKLKIKRFGAGTPRRSSPMFDYYEKNRAIILAERKEKHLKKCYLIQNKEREDNLKRMQARLEINAIVPSPRTPINPDGE